MTTTCPAYDGSVQTSWYPVWLVLTTRSPPAARAAPNATPGKTVPSSRASNAGLRVRGDMRRLPVANGAVDACVYCASLHHAPLAGALEEAARVLRPGGLFMLTTPNRLTFSPGLDKPVNPFHTHEFSALELSNLVGHNGLVVTAMRGLCAGGRLLELDAKHGGVGGFVSAQLASAPDSWLARCRPMLLQ